MINARWTVDKLKSLGISCLGQSALVILLPCLIPEIGWAVPPDSVPQLQAQSLPRPAFQRTIPVPSELPDILPQMLLPAPEELLPTPTSPNSKPTTLPEFPTQVTIKRFEIVGGTVFTAAQLTAITNSATNRPIDFAQLLQVANNITQLYVRNGYVSSGAYIPGNQSFSTKDSVVKIQIVEGRVEDIIVKGTTRLDPDYIRSRITLGTNQPLKVDRLLGRLRLLQQDPLIAKISAELVTGREVGTSTIQVNVTEAPSKKIGFNVINNRTPSVGEIQGQAFFSEGNLLGIGDAFGVAYGATEAGDVLDLSYTVPINAHNGTIRLQYSSSTSRVIEPPFQPLNITASARDLAVTYRQPIIQTLPQELGVGITLAQRESNASYLPNAAGDRLGFPAPGADSNGQTRLTVARFFQDFTTRDTQQILALRSQLSVGLNALDATVNSASPDGQFVSWRGQAQYAKTLGYNSIFLLKFDSQFADRPLVPLEQISWGGQDTVRGYRQDLLIGDNGLLASAEVRLPIFSSSDNRDVLQLVPFLDMGMAWSNATILDVTPNTIAGVGLGLRYQSGNNFLAKIDYGIPLVGFDISKRTGQEQGLYFSIGYNHSF